MNRELLKRLAAALDPYLAKPDPSYFFTMKTTGDDPYEEGVVALLSVDDETYTLTLVKEKE